MPSEQCLVVKAHNGFLLALSPGLLLIKHLSVSAHYYPACFCFLNPRHSAACRRTTFTGGENEFEWIPSFFLEGIWLFSANNLLPSCGETGNCIRPLGIPTCI